jgi:hypothetical protein
MQWFLQFAEQREKEYEVTLIFHDLSSTLLISLETDAKRSKLKCSNERVPSERLYLAGGLWSQ